jgi:hypothetical protein
MTVVLCVQCFECGERHEAVPVHVSETQGQIYAVVCPVDGLTDYYTSEVTEPMPPRRSK